MRRVKILVWLKIEVPWHNHYQSTAFHQFLFEEGHHSLESKHLATHTHPSWSLPVFRLGILATLLGSRPRNCLSHSLSTDIFVKFPVCELLCVAGRTASTSTSVVDDGSVGYWLGAKRARGSHDGTCMYDQWKWVDSYGRALSTVSGLTAFIPGKPDKYVTVFVPTGARIAYNRSRSIINR